MVVIFGSHAKGTAGRDSDVDVLVVLSRPDQVHVADAALETQIDDRVALEPVVVTIGDLVPPRSYFLYNALRTGKEIFAMPAEDLKREERGNLIGLAEEYLAGATHALTADQTRIAVDASYNAAELAVKSMVLERDDDLPGSHGGLVGRFGEVYVKPGIVDRSLGGRLNQALERRNHARYRFHASIGVADAEQVIDLAGELIHLARGRLGSTP